MGIGMRMDMVVVVCIAVGFDRSGLDYMLNCVSLLISYLVMWACGLVAVWVCGFVSRVGRHGCLGSVYLQ